MRRPLVVLAILPVLAVAASAEIVLPALLTDGAVLQRGMPVAVWGRAQPGERVTVAFAGQRKTATADDEGAWSVTLDTLRESRRPRELSIRGSAGGRAVVKDVLVGEVWLCSGQSNMAWPLRQARDGAAEVAAASFPGIRLITVPRKPAEVSQADFAGRWAACSPQSAAVFSAVGFFFGRELHQELKVPIGLVNSSFGGTPAEAWTSPGALEAEPGLKGLRDRWTKAVERYDPDAAKKRLETQLKAWKKAVENAKAEGRRAPRRPRLAADPRLSPHRPANLYRGMIAPLVPYAIRGVIWYQGESNAGRAHQYRTVFPTMIRDWRRAWNRESLPFHFVQLANWRAASPDPVDSAWAELREAQLMTLRSVPHTGMAVIVDIGEANDIHPRNKQDVGRRLAVWALAKQYGQEIPFSGPLYRAHERRGAEVVIRFDHADDGLVARGDEGLRGFAIAGEDRRFVWANARIEGDAVVVSHPDVPEPVAVRYAWADNPPATLYDGAGLPASPFRTDEWPGITDGKD